jgi:hypothetical protein
MYLFNNNSEKKIRWRSASQKNEYVNYVPNYFSFSNPKSSFFNVTTLVRPRKI